MIRLVAHNQLGTAVGSLGTAPCLVVLHDGQILFHCLRRVLQVDEVFEKPLVVL